MDLRNEMLPEARELAQRTGAMIELACNGVVFWVYPRDTVADLQAAFDRLYPRARGISVNLAKLDGRAA